MEFLPFTRDIMLALVLFTNPTNEHYVGRQAALLMDDNPGIRLTLKAIAVNEGYMYGYQATLFDDGFGASCQALQILRQARIRRIESKLPNYEIRR